MAVIGLQAAAAAVVFHFDRYALKIGCKTESPALAAEGIHRQVDAAASLIVMASLTLGFVKFQWKALGLGIDQFAAILVLVFIALTGWKLLCDAMRVLLDAPIDLETLELIRKIVAGEPMVTEIKSLLGRNAGRLPFLRIQIAMRGTDLQKAHKVSERIEQHRGAA